MSTSEHIHFIAIGGSVMHNLAIELHQKGYKVTGSDDEIYEPSQSRLRTEGILPEEKGWFPEKLSSSIDAVILGMHARSNNPELLKAQELGIKVYSYPEYLFEHSKNKQRVVIAGSHGKTTVTSMILHVLKATNKTFDYIVGASLAGFDKSVSLTKKAPTIIIEGDEYSSSPTDQTPKFLHYKPHIAVLTGIAWDHYNVFPTAAAYEKAFEDFVKSLDKAGNLIFDETDSTVKRICETFAHPDVQKYPYSEFKASIKNGKTYLKKSLFDSVPIEVFGAHNLKNIRAAFEVCEKLGITDDQFYQAISTFKGASKRLEVLDSNSKTTIFRDFAHAPSKVGATTSAVKKQFSGRKLTAVAELHTFSSLNKGFIQQYRDTLKDADNAVVFYSPETVAQKQLEAIQTHEITQAFNRSDLKVFTDVKELTSYLLEINWNDRNLLLMSSGIFGGIDLKALSEGVLKK